jgi:hypothetical protein
MGLIANVFVAAVIIIVILVAVSYLSGGVSVQLPKTQAVIDVTNYFKQFYPNSIVNVTNVTLTPSATNPGNWSILAHVIINGTRACPSDFEDVFTYPAFGIVNNTQNTYSSGSSTHCMVNGSTIGSATMAIAWAYSKLNVSQVHAFISRYAYPNVPTTASTVATSLTSGSSTTPRRSPTIRYRL